MRIKLFSVGALFALVFAACSSSAAEEAAAPSAIGANQQLTEVDGDDAEQFENLWQQYLVAYDDAYAAGSVGELDDLASQSVVDALSVEVVENNVKKADSELDAVQEMSSSGELVSAEHGGDRAQIVDCTTHRIRLPLGEPFDIYTERQISFTNDGDRWLISGIEVLRDGWFAESADFGCVPQEIADEALRVGKIFQTEVLVVEGDPSKGLSDEMIDIAAPELVGPLRQGLDALAAEGYRSDSPVEVSFEVEGLNYLFASLEGPVVQVLACVVYPEGQVVRSGETGEVVEELLGVGSSRVALLDVVVREGLEGEVVNVDSFDGGC